MKMRINVCKGRTDDCVTITMTKMTKWDNGDNISNINLTTANNDENECKSSGRLSNKCIKDSSFETLVVQHT